MQSGGWDGAFAIDAEAHGDGPPGIEEMLTQELQWSRSLGTILLRWAPGRLRKVPMRARLRLGFALLFYPLQSLVLITGSLLPAAALVFDRSWVSTSLAGFYVRVWICSVLLIAIVAHLRRAGALRPVGAKLWSLDAVLFQLVRWPWAAYGCLQGMWDYRRTTPRTFKVTPKGETTFRRLRPAHVNPMILLGYIPAMAVVFATSPRLAIGFVFVATIQAVLYLAAAVTMIVLHVRSNRRRQVREAAGPAFPRRGARRPAARHRGRGGDQRRRRPGLDRRRARLALRDLRRHVRCTRSPTVTRPASRTST